MSACTCWSCGISGECVIIMDEGEPVHTPCCRVCWDVLSVRERLDAARLFVDQRHRTNLPVVLYQLAEMLANANEGGGEGHSRPSMPWDRN